MEKSNNYTEKLSRLLYYGAIAAILFVVCRYFSNVLIYIILSGVLSLISQPVMRLLRKITVKGHRAPDWLLAVITIFILLLILAAAVSGIVPLISEVVREVSALASGTSLGTISTSLANINRFLIDKFNLAPRFKLEQILIEQLRNIFDFGKFGNWIGSLASVVANAGVGIFSVVFISFFFIKDESLFTRIVKALSPDRMEEKVTSAIGDVEHLLSRYFIGLFIEMSCVGLIDFLGLWAVARLDFETAIGVGFLAGLLNVIPYLGPIIGGVVGTVMGVTLRYCSGGSLGLDVNFWVFVIILIAIFVVAQMVDNFFLQPFIYSTSIQATPLEIFIVMLLAGNLGGMFGMVAAIPAYTVIRVIAGRFFPDVKFIKQLLGK